LLRRQEFFPLLHQPDLEKDEGVRRRDPQLDHEAPRFDVARWIYGAVDNDAISVLGFAPGERTAREQIAEYTLEFALHEPAQHSVVRQEGVRRALPHGETPHQNHQTTHAQLD